MDVETGQRSVPAAGRSVRQDKRRRIERSASTFVHGLLTKYICGDEFDWHSWSALSDFRLKDRDISATVFSTDQTFTHFLNGIMSLRRLASPHLHSLLVPVLFCLADGPATAASTNAESNRFPMIERLEQRRSSIVMSTSTAFMVLSGPNVFLHQVSYLSCRYTCASHYVLTRWNLLQADSETFRFHASSSSSKAWDIAGVLKALLFHGESEDPTPLGVKIMHHLGGSEVGCFGALHLLIPGFRMAGTTRYSAVGTKMSDLLIYDRPGYVTASTRSTLDVCMYECDWIPSMYMLCAA